MPTDLAKTFRTLFRKKDGQWIAFETPHEHDQFLNTLSRSPTSKIWTTAKKPRDLWSVPKTSLLISEVSIMGGSSLGKRFRMQILQSTKPQEFTLPISLHERIQGKSLCIGYGLADSELLNEWFEDASALIDTGNLIYLPERILMVKDGPAHWTGERLDPTEKWSIMKPFLDGQQNSQTLVTLDGESFSEQEIIDLMGIQLPVIDSMSLAGFSQFLKQEGDSVVLLRSAIRKALQECARVGKNSPDACAITSAVAQVKGDLIEPAISQLNIRYQNIIRCKAFGVGGASVSTIGLSLAMWLDPSIATIVAMLGSSGLVASMREIDDYTKQVSALKNDPWYLLWKLRRIVPRT